MATLVLTAVGTLVGGPIGGAIGAILGQQADRMLFAPGRRGPRLEDLRVQTSSYGSQIPKVFGTMRVAGTVIWATDLIETPGGGGKAGGSGYSYAANFAVAISGRPVRAVGRIWADGNLLRGAAGDFKTATDYRLHLGGEDQGVDPLIASAEADAPAYRGIAYAVFENFELAAYGNRIPSLTFEVEADDGPVTIAEIAAELSDGEIGGDAPRALSGYAASGDSVRAAVETLARAAPLSLADTGEGLALVAPAAVEAVLHAAELAASADGARQDRYSQQRSAVLPVEINVAYYEPERDYQAGLQRARRPGAGRLSEQIELPATLSAHDAKRIAEANLARRWIERTERTVTLPWRRLALKPGTHLAVPGAGGRWRVAHWAFERMVLALTLVRVTAPVFDPGDIAEPGRPVTPPDVPHGPTVLHLLDLPALGDAPEVAPRLLIAAAGPSRGWRRAELSLSIDDGASWGAIGMTAASSIIGTVSTSLSAGSAMLFDDVNSVEVTLLHDDMALSDADDTRLLAGENLAVIGDELVQFGRAEPLGGGSYRLSRLLRGRRGTEHAMATHGDGERFVLLMPDRLRSCDPPLASIGAAALAMASGVGDADPAEAGAEAIGMALRPPAPVGFHATTDGAGGFILRWTRRSRGGWRWLDSVDVPLVEEREAYRIDMVRAGTIVRSIEVEAPEASYPAAAFAADRGTADGVVLSLVQLGTHAASLPVSLTIEA